MLAPLRTFTMWSCALTSGISTLDKQLEGFQSYLSKFLSHALGANCVHITKDSTGLPIQDLDPRSPSHQMRDNDSAHDIVTTCSPSTVNQDKSMSSLICYEILDDQITNPAANPRPACRRILRTFRWALVLRARKSTWRSGQAPQARIPFALIVFYT